MSNTLATRGMWVALEGPDGVGKTTQANLLAKWLHKRTGIEPVVVGEPGGTLGGKALRSLLFPPVGEPPLFESETARQLLFQASMAETYVSIIRPSIEAGVSVISDRWTMSHVAYNQFRLPNFMWTEYDDDITYRVTGSLESQQVREPDVNVVWVADSPVDAATLLTSRIRERQSKQGLLTHQDPVFDDLRRISACYNWMQSSWPTDIIRVPIKEQNENSASLYIGRKLRDWYHKQNKFMVYQSEASQGL